MDPDFMTDDDMIGELTIPLGQSLRDVKHISPGWLPIMAADNVTKVGDIHVKIEWLSNTGRIQDLAADDLAADLAANDMPPVMTRAEMVQAWDDGVGIDQDLPGSPVRPQSIHCPSQCLSAGDSELTRPPFCHAVGLDPEANRTCRAATATPQTQSRRPVRPLASAAARGRSLNRGSAADDL